MSIVQAYVREILSKTKTDERGKTESELELTDHPTLLKKDIL